MNIQLLRKSIKLWLFIISIISFNGCDGQVLHVAEIIRCVEISDPNYTFSEESKLVVADVHYSQRQKAIYNSNGKIEKLIVYKPEGVMEYSLNELLKDVSILEYYGFPLEQNMQFNGSNIIDNLDKIDVQKLAENYFSSNKNGLTTLYKIDDN